MPKLLFVLVITFGVLAWSTSEASCPAPGSQTHITCEVAFLAQYGARETRNCFASQTQSSDVEEVRVTVIQTFFGYRAPSTRTFYVTKVCEDTWEEFADDWYENQSEFYDYPQETTDGNGQVSALAQQWHEQSCNFSSTPSFRVTQRVASGMTYHTAGGTGVSFTISYWMFTPSPQHQGACYGNMYPSY